MKISCECHERGLLPLDTEILVRDRSLDVCECCKQAPATELCSIGHLRQFARAEDVVHLCKRCHEAGHQNILEMATKLGPHFLEVISEIT